MSKKWIIFFPLIICLFLSAPRVYPADETDLFKASAPPDALIVLDKSSSMTLPVCGWTMYTDAASPCQSYDNNPYYSVKKPGYEQECDIYSGTYPHPVYSDSSCSVGPFYRSPISGYTTDCSRLAIAKRAVKSMLDANNDGVVDDNDYNLLQVRFGYMTFFQTDTGNDPMDGNVKVIKVIPTDYGTLWTSFNNEPKNSGTPLVDALEEARIYLNDHRTNDTEAGACRKKFVILLSDGEDSYFACTGDSFGAHPKKRRAVVTRAKELLADQFKLFVIGLYDDDPLNWLSYNLNWAAYYGGTDNPLSPNSGNPGGFTPPADACVYTDGDPDPGAIPLSGYAFLAKDGPQINEALRKIKDMILEAKYSFSNVSVPSSRIEGENFLYQASFKPVSGDPFWLGSINKYSINLTDGSLGSDPVDAGEKLKAKNAADRKIYTRTDGAVKLFNTDLSETFFNASVDERNAIIGYIRGESAYNKEDWKLGDTFHSEVKVIGSPSAYFNDVRSPEAYDAFRNSGKIRERIVVAGANDGQLHAFSASTMEEKWSFIPPNLLPKLKYITHSSHPAPSDKRDHQYFVDGPITAADVWWKEGKTGLGDKDGSEWKTLLIVSEGRGVRDQNGDTGFLWSSSIYCDQGFNKTYSDPYHFYCGYHALNVTETGAVSPTYLWRIRTWGVPGAAYLSEPWSRMAVGRVKIGGYEKWLGFIGGGLDGKGFFVIDLSSGDILWNYTKSNNAAMDYGIPASPTVVDVDNDGFIDTAYVGDRGGNMWRFKFCMDTDGPTCNKSNWQGGLFFQAPTGQIRPIFTTAAVSKDNSGSLWVFWGTGDKLDPTSADAQEKFYALSDDDRTTTYNINNLINIGPNGSYSGKKPGWYVTLGGGGEKMLADPTVFGGIVLFTTYTPTTSGGDLCASGGDAKLYAMAMMSLVINGITYDPGAGVLSEGSPSNKDGGNKWVSIGKGIPGAPVISQPPTGSTGSTDLYVPISGAEGKSSAMKTDDQLGDNPLTRRFRETSPRSQMIHWRDMRLTP
jgi:hypothetical protein